ncbi:MAG: beta-ketoacyl synthase N-terminal-like domain-containing protein, partial [Chloroflexota bacterium]
MHKVAILGIGQTKIDEHWERSLRDLAGDAIISALEDANRMTCDGLFIGNMLSGMIDQQNNLGALITDWSGLRQVEAVKVEAACASGSAAFRSGLMAIACGEMESAMVLGVEKMTDSLPQQVTAFLASASDADYEGEQG